MHIQPIGLYKALAAMTLALCTAATLPAAAAVDVEVSASNYRYTVTDLTPDDGQAAAFFGNLRQVTNHVQASVQQGDTIVFSDARQSRYPTDKPPSVSWDGGLSGESSFAFDADGNVTGQFLSGALTIPEDMRGRVETTASTSNIFFELAPHSEVSMFLDVVMKLHTAPGSEATGSALVGLWARADGEEMNRATISGNVGLWNGSFTGLVDYAEALTVGIVNPSDEWIYGSFGFYANANIAQGVVTAVPEASAPAMLAMGLGFLGLLGRHRARARPASVQGDDARPRRRAARRR